MSWLARTIINLGQLTPFAGRGSYSANSLSGRGRKSEFPQADEEASRAADFHAFFESDMVASALAGNEVLDFGSGYGGRTVEYARAGARFVWGVEPFQSVVDQSNAYARSREVSNVEFKLCKQDYIPLADESVDTVVSYDVLEHVDDPRVSVREIRRVLRPRGRIFLVFPVYFGAFSHHLDYISMVPGLHWFFSPHTLVRTVNGMLAKQTRIETQQQPLPRLSFDGKRHVLPNLNGLGGEHLEELFREFDVHRMHRHGYIKRRQLRSRTMQAMSFVLPNRLADMITFSVSCVLQKR